MNGSHLAVVATRDGRARHFGDRGLDSRALPERTLCGREPDVRRTLAVVDHSLRLRDCGHCAAILRLGTA